jgi:hypothetical protein
MVGSRCLERPGVPTRASAAKRARAELGARGPRKPVASGAHRRKRRSGLWRRSSPARRNPSRSAGR